jgi:CheY-like chemotaxis protein
MGAEADRLAMGFAQSLLKPVRQSQLFEAIANALEAPVQKVVDNTKSVEGLPDYHLKRILVAEDNKVNQKVIIAMLGKFQNKPDLAENGQEAIDLIKHQRYDLILMDCQMPVLDGYEAVRILRGQELAGNGVRIPVVALTAHAAAGEREKCLSAGMDDFLSKPIARPDLAKILARWLGEFIPSNGIQDQKEDMVDATAGNACWDEESALRRLDDDLELLNEMIDLFLTEVPAKMHDLEEALADADYAAMADAAHAIKGMAGHFCADQLRSCAASLEGSARLGHSVDFQQMTEYVANATTSLVSALKQKQGESL